MTRLHVGDVRNVICTQITTASRVSSVQQANTHALWNFGTHAKPTRPHARLHRLYTQPPQREQQTLTTQKWNCCDLVVHSCLSWRICWLNSVLLSRSASEHLQIRGNRMPECCKAGHKISGGFWLWGISWVYKKMFKSHVHKIAASKPKPALDI